MSLSDQVLCDSEWHYTTPICFILECVSMVLTLNVFKFRNNFYLQKQGTSMGSTCAPSLAGLYVYQLEKHKILNEFNPFRDNIPTWRRYIDDVFLIWTGPETRAKDFLDWLNRHDPFLKFTCTMSRTELVFLDLNIRVENDTLISNTHTKPTAHNSPLTFSSFHP